MAKILITGGLGPTGKLIAIKLLEKGYEVVIVDNLSNSSITALDEIEQASGIRPAYENINCMDYMLMDKLFESHPGISAIIHLAIKKDEGKTMKQPLPIYRNNMNVLLNLLELMPLHKVPFLVFAPYGRTLQVSESIVHDALEAEQSIRAILLPEQDKEASVEAHVNVIETLVKV